MQSDSGPTIQPGSSRSFIEEARRQQIVEATIQTLAAHGYINTTFARIAKTAGISPSLIPYHFKDKDELSHVVVKTIVQERLGNIRQHISKDMSARDKLKTILEVDVRYMGLRPERFQAYVEVLFSKRSIAGAINYMGETSTLDTLVRDALIEGQQRGEFGDFDPDNLALIIDAARDSFLAQLPHHKEYNLDRFTTTLVELALREAERVSK
jgi:AcrR family transcriptional regulator